MAIQEKEASLIRQMLPEKAVVTVGHSSRFSAPPADPGISISSSTEITAVSIGFVGVNSIPNRMAAETLLDRIWPGVYEAHKGKAAVHLAGAVCSYIARKKTVGAVHLWGCLEDLEPFYAATDIIVNPVTMGGGLKIKNVEVLTHGLPLLTTGLGAEGLEDGAGTAFYLCDTTERMQEKLSELIGSPRLRAEMAARAYRYALKRFDPEAVYGPFVELLQGYGNSSRTCAKAPISPPADQVSH